MAVSLPGEGTDTEPPRELGKGAGPRALGRLCPNDVAMSKEQWFVFRFVSLIRG